MSRLLLLLLASCGTTYVAPVDISASNKIPDGMMACATEQVYHISEEGKLICFDNENRYYECKELDYAR